MENCIFCQIAAKQAPAKLVYEDTEFVAFHDIDPKAPVHVLVVPREHVPRLADYPESAEGEQKMGRLLATVNRVARELDLEGYRVLVNVGFQGGQRVFHVHAHLISGL
jgi:histidine triad (HIT) family protein